MSQSGLAVCDLIHARFVGPAPSRARPAAVVGAAESLHSGIGAIRFFVLSFHFSGPFQRGLKTIALDR